MENEKKYPEEQQKLKDYLDNVTIEQIIEKLKNNDGMTWWVDWQDQYQPCFKKVYDKEVDLIVDYISNLEERCAYLERSNNRREDTILGLRQETQEQKDYKSRCTKAILYIIGHRPYEDREYLLNLLGNGSEDND